MGLCRSARCALRICLCTVDDGVGFNRVDPSVFLEACLACARSVGGKEGQGEMVDGACPKTE